MPKFRPLSLKEQRIVVAVLATLVCFETLLIAVLISKPVVPPIQASNEPTPVVPTTPQPTTVAPPKVPTTAEITPKPVEPPVAVAPKPILDADQMSPEEALTGSKAPASLLAKMEVVPITHYGFDSQLHQGQIVVDKAVAAEVKEIFHEIEETKYPITQIIPIVHYDWDDQASIDDNNTSAFNYRHVIAPGRVTNKLSNHSFGRAIDLNPKINPFVSASGSTPRPYDPSAPGTLTRESPVTQIFLKHGWIWGGSWKGGKDYQHFEKPGGSARATEL